MDMEFILGTVYGLSILLLKVFLIVVPLMMLLEIFREFRLLDLMTDLTHRPLSRLGFKKDSIYPLVAGVVFGISYGGGVLIGESDAGRIKGSQNFLVALYLGLCHAVFEDTLIFVSLGANGIVVLAARLILATAVVFVVSTLVTERNN